MRLPMEIRVLTALAALLAAMAGAAVAIGAGAGAGAAASGTHVLHLSAAASPLAGTDDPGTWGWG